MTIAPPRHRVIRASAGTGKTFALSSRYLRLLMEGAAPESILATTFTRKAAGEILGRVLQRIALGARDEKSAAALAGELKSPELTLARCREMLQTLARALHRVSISTIDSFFNRMAQSFRLELGIPPDPSLLAPGDPLAVRVRGQAIDALLADANPRVMVDLLRRAHHDAAHRSVTAAIDDIVANLHDVYRQAPDAALWSQLAVPPPVDGAKIRGAIKRLTDATPGVGHKTAAKALMNNLESALAEDWQAFLQSGLAAKAAAGADTYSRWPIPSHVAEPMNLLIRHAKAQLLGALARQTQATFELLKRFDAHFTRLMEAERIVLFTDLPYRLARGLPELSDVDAPGLDALYYRLDARVAHLLLDEFQDTSPLQWEVLKPLAQEIAAHGDGSRSFFCVGDVKQAIYGWRGGCAELFDQIESDLHLSPDSRRQLNESRRSSRVVLDAVNRVFSSLAQSPAFAADERLTAIAAAWQAGFTAHKAHQTELPGYVALTTSIAAEAQEQEPEDDAEDQHDDESPVARPTTHQAFVAGRIAELVAAAPGRSVGVLVATNAMVNQLIHLLRAANVPASGEGGSPVTDDPAVAAVLAAIRLADHSGDSAAAFHLIHTPLGPILGLDPRKLDPLKLDLRMVGDLSLRIRLRLAAEGYAAVIVDWARALAPHCDKRNVLRLGQLVQLADDFQARATLRPGDFARFVAATSVEDPNPAAVRVMTVHKAKGLEFDLVVLPELDRRLDSGGRQQVYVVRDHPTGPVTAVYRAAATALRTLSPELTEGYWQERGRRVRDDLCGLYVAMTRARQAVHMVIKPLKPMKDGRPGAAGRANLSHAAILRGALSEPGDAEDMAGGQTLYAQGEAGWAGPPAKPAKHAEIHGAAPLALAKGGATRSWRIVAPSSLEAGSRVSAADLLDLEPAQSRRRGTVMHAFFERIEYLPAPDDQSLRAAARRVAGDAEAGQIDAWLAQFRRMLGRPAVAARLTRPPEAAGETAEVWRERSFAVRDGATLVRGSFDRVLVRRRAGRPIAAALIDFKTDRFDPADPAALERLAGRYRPQIQAYRRALAAMLGLEDDAVSAELLMVDSGDAIAV